MALAEVAVEVVNEKKVGNHSVNESVDVAGKVVLAVVII